MCRVASKPLILEADVHQNDVRLDICGFLNCLESIGRCAYDFEVSFRFKYRSNQMLPRQEIIDD